MVALQQIHNSLLIHNGLIIALTSKQQTFTAWQTSLKGVALNDYVAYFLRFCAFLSIGLHPVSPILV